MPAPDITKHVKRTYKVVYAGRQVNAQTIRQSVIANLLKAGNDISTVRAFAGHKYVIRGQKVMIDQDLSEMYGVETKQLKRQVKRNMDRFPKDFMFELTKKEFENLRGQIGTSSWGGTRYKGVDRKAKFSAS